MVELTRRQFCIRLLAASTYLFSPGRTLDALSEYDKEDLGPGNVFVKTSKSSTGYLLVDPDHRFQVQVPEKLAVTYPLQVQSKSFDGSLEFKVAGNNILAFPTAGGTPGTAARAEDKMRFTGPLAIGGLRLYGAAVQSQNDLQKVLLFEAYSRSHHQRTVWQAPLGTSIEWLLWGGKNNQILLIILKSDGISSLYCLYPTFPDFENSQKDCFYSNKPATDCMIRDIANIKREAILLCEDVEGVTVAA